MIEEFNRKEAQAMCDLHICNTCGGNLVLTYGRIPHSQRSTYGSILFKDNVGRLLESVKGLIHG